VNATVTVSSIYYDQARGQHADPTPPTVISLLLLSREIGNTTKSVRYRSAGGKGWGMCALLAFHFKLSPLCWLQILGNNEWVLSGWNDYNGIFQWSLFRLILPFFPQTAWERT